MPTITGSCDMTNNPGGHNLVPGLASEIHESTKEIEPQSQSLDRTHTSDDRCLHKVFVDIETLPVSINDSTLLDFNDYSGLTDYSVDPFQSFDEQNETAGELLDVYDASRGM
jgi:hypothetical protein